MAKIPDIALDHARLRARVLELEEALVVAGQGLEKAAKTIEALSYWLLRADQLHIAIGSGLEETELDVANHIVEVLHSVGFDPDEAPAQLLLRKGEANFLPTPQVKKG